MKREGRWVDITADHDEARPWITDPPLDADLLARCWEEMSACGPSRYCAALVLMEEDDGQ